ncbi:DUF4398 domain-containing protein [Wenzhouxiangella sp. AB-CW3]|uniref:DUF4398 domain-containing protein n=1 Tax=Wenzhouxiangella sp. AB-CW3 TaxID=2771012 RepID=UPI00168BBE6D|nr:DUF4398 domain-containing protein [Wenzhouxiangella sp. AB-CW3]QOC22058.1 DUF4398 domain-containing protein [Wenzhouxiangella sp. AB-CW3]
MKSAAVPAVSLLLLGACASTPQPPTESLSDARQAIANAEQSDARQYASAELDEARSQLSLAERSVGQERMTEADRFARQSRIAAELAIARTGSAKAAEINHEIQRSTEALLEEMRRTGDRQ